MGRSVCFLVSFLVLVGIIVALVKYIQKPSYHGKGYDKLIEREGFVIRTSQFDVDMRVEVNGENWIAKSESSHVFEIGDKIVIKKIDLDKMILLVELVNG